MPILSLIAILAAQIAPGQIDFDRALRNYRLLLSGQKQLLEIPADQRDELVRFERVVRPVRSSGETKAECEARTLSRSPSDLERALTDLKCSARP